MNRSAKTCDLALLFSALADQTRLRLLNLIADREVCVCHLVEILEQGQPKISRHLAYLRRAGLVAARREGKWMHYRIVTSEDAGVTRILEQTLQALQEDQRMRADRARLPASCCGDARPVTSTGDESGCCSR